MSLLSYVELIELIEQGVINAPLENVNGSSIDITLGKSIRIESNLGENGNIDLKNKENIHTHEVIISEDGYYLVPGEFILASSQEVFNLPDNIAAEYVLKSSLARNACNHMLAGFCDPGWSNSTLTLEIKNESRFNNLILRESMKIGQMKFYRVNPVPNHASYAITGQYNNQTGATASRGIR